MEPCGTPYLTLSLSSDKTWFNCHDIFKTQHLIKETFIKKHVDD